MTPPRPCPATKTGNSNTSVLTCWKNVNTIPTLFKVSHILKFQLPDAKPANVCSSLAQGSKGKWVIYH
jgi:hypothetical protein